MKKSVVIYGVKTFPSLGGTDRVAENLALQLKDKYDITLYCYKSPWAKNHIDGIRVVQFTPWMKGAMGAFIYFFVSAVYLLCEKKADLVHAHKTDCAFFIPLLRLRFKVVCTSHEAPYKRDKWNWFVKLYFVLVERMFVKHADVSTCVSMPLTKYYEKKYQKKVHFIPNGINRVEQSNYDSTLATTFLPKGASLDKDFILFSARRLMATKGCHTMLEALHKVHYPGQVFIAGELHADDPYLHKLIRLSFGLNVHFLGFVSPLPPLFALIDHAQIFIFPSETEGMSIMLLEVASVGVPIIASDIPENTQVFNDSEVLYFKTKNPNDLAEKIRFALAHPESMLRLGHNSRQKVITDYLWSNLALSYSQVYEEAMMI